MAKKVVASTSVHDRSIVVFSSYDDLADVDSAKCWRSEIKGGVCSNAQVSFILLCSFAEIRYLDGYTDRLGVYALSKKANVRSSITSWLESRSTVNDIVFVYFSSHGGGYKTIDGWDDGRVEFGGDEGDEVGENNYKIANFVLLPYLDPWPLNELVAFGSDSARASASLGMIIWLACWS